MHEPLAIVMAAGKGTRMKSDLPKVLVPVLGRPMIEYVIDALNKGGIRRTVVVVGYRADLVREKLAGRSGVQFAEQHEQLGTGHAVMMCREALAGQDGPVMVVAGDSPMIKSASVARVLGEFASHPSACLMGTLHKPDPTGLGRIVRDAEGEFAGIVEERDATPEQRRITEVNMSCYVFRGPDLLEALAKLEPKNAQGEFYLTDCPGLLRQWGREVRALPVLHPSEALSINNPDELAVVEEAMRNER